MIYTQELCDKVILENGGMLPTFICDCYKYQKMCYKVFDNFADELEFVPDSYKTKKMCNRVICKQCLSFCNTICPWML